MCGIAGFVDVRPARSEADGRRIVTAMADAIRHRGPDAQDAYVESGGDGAVRVALGHRRLSILDLSEAGGQPMASASRRWVITYNGEIYNCMRLRADLEAAGAAPAWRGHSDTEILLAAIEAWGLEAALRRAYGMFALAIWDRAEQTLALARDRMGEKPLYLARTECGWAFASELKALQLAPGFAPKLDRAAMSAYFFHGYVPEGFCIFEGVQKIPPGCIITLRADGGTSPPQPYETFAAIAAQGIAEREARNGTFDIAASSRQLEGCLEEVVGEQMLSDVPLGCFLSGGIDSSLVASLMQAQRNTQARTFSIGFRESRFNEADYAAAVARHLRTEHTEFILSEDDALAVVLDLPEIYDEPFSDSSQIPITLLCREARKAVTVALTGDGGDEMFGGYNRHVLGPKLWRRARAVPRWLLRPAARATACLAGVSAREDGIARRIAARLRLPVTAIDKAAGISSALVEADDLADLYNHFVCTFAHPEALMASSGASDSFRATRSELGIRDDAEWLMAMDSRGYLPGDILVKVDRAAMSVSLETRAPLLDARVAAMAWRLPGGARIRRGVGKFILRNILDRHVPRRLVERPKQGFAIPLDHWLRNGLRGWAGAMLENEDLFRLAGLDREPAIRLWQEHQSGRANRGHKLWTIVMFLAWLDRVSPRLAG